MVISTGANYDEDGKKNNWWTDNDHKEFGARAECFEKEYNNTYDKQANMTVRIIISDGNFYTLIIFVVECNERFGREHRRQRRTS